MDMSIRYNAIGPWLRECFGCRMVKLSLNAELTCPNRDGSKGSGGCAFCSDAGSGDFASSLSKMEEQVKLISRKWPDAQYIAYFQSHSNTYAPVETLRKLWDEALVFPGVKCLAIATRPDCLPPEVLELLEEYAKKTFLWVELGLQTAKDSSAEKLNRCYGSKDFEAAAGELNKRNIPFLVHLILGLPGESREDMLASARYAASFKPFGIKLHMLHIIKGTKLAEIYEAEPFHILSLEEYAGTVCDILEELPEEITIHRLTGDAPGPLLVAPEWSRNKHTVLNSIQKELKARKSFQGCKYRKE